MCCVSGMCFFQQVEKDKKNKNNLMSLLLEAEVVIIWKDLKFRGIILHIRGKRERGQWDRVSWHCQSSAWQKTCSQTIAGILSRRLKVSILVGMSEHSGFDWWGFRCRTFLGWRSLRLVCLHMWIRVKRSQICWVIITRGHHVCMTNGLF